VTSRIALIAGGAAAAAAVAYGLVRRRPAPVLTEPELEGPDPRAEELREKLAASRELAAERDEFEAGETPVDAVDAAEDVDARRREVHERGRAAVDEMQQDN
jgi:hypothetical protein